MTKKTHISLGIAAATGLSLFIPEIRTNSLPQLMFGIFLATTGSIIPDIDFSNTTKVRENFKKIFIMAGLVLVCVLLYGYITNFLRDIIYLILYEKYVYGSLLFLLMCFIGYISPHRTFTHYLIGLLCFMFPIYLIIGSTFTIWFGIGMLSHQLIDMLNKKRIRWLFPFEIDFSLYLCKSNGIINELIGYVSGILSIIFIITIIL